MTSERPNRLNQIEEAAPKRPEAMALTTSRGFGIVLLLTVSAACGAADSKDGVLDRLPAEAMSFSRCPPKGTRADTSDLNGDGRNDVQHGRSKGRRVCSAYDLDFDGRADVIRFYEKDGRTAKREEHDFDFDGRIDQVSFFKRGALHRKDLDSNFDGRMDTRVWCRRGAVLRAVRDRLNDGFADTWEQYASGRVRYVKYDTNGDGVPDLAEKFKNGVIQELRYDDDLDGKFDRRTRVEARDAGAQEMPVSCELPADIEERPRATLPSDGEEETGPAPDLDGDVGTGPGSEQTPASSQGDKGGAETGTPSDGSEEKKNGGDQPRSGETQPKTSDSNGDKDGASGGVEK